MTTQGTILIYSYICLFPITLITCLVLARKEKLCKGEIIFEKVSISFILAALNIIVVPALIFYLIIIKPCMWLATPPTKTHIDESGGYKSYIDEIVIRPPKITSYICEYCNQTNSIKIITCPNCGAPNEESRI